MVRTAGVGLAYGRLWSPAVNLVAFANAIFFSMSLTVLPVSSVLGLHISYLTLNFATKGHSCQRKVVEGQ